MDKGVLLLIICDGCCFLSLPGLLPFLFWTFSFSKDTQSHKLSGSLGTVVLANCRAENSWNPLAFIVGTYRVLN